jgi:hypothetical protein
MAASVNFGERRTAEAVALAYREPEFATGAMNPTKWLFKSDRNLSVRLAIRNLFTFDELAPSSPSCRRNACHSIGGSYSSRSDLEAQLSSPAS